MKIGGLRENRRFRLPYSGRVGSVVAPGEMGTRVIYDGTRRKVRIESKQTGQVAEFDAPGRVVIISNGTEVEPLGKDS